MFSTAKYLAVVFVPSPKIPNNSHSDDLCNADMGLEQIRKFCPLDSSSKSILNSAMQQMNLSARSYHRVLKLARTIADLSGEENITPTHLAEALQYRPKEQ
jgi:magnesium chelatase family protein